MQTRFTFILLALLVLPSSAFALSGAVSGNWTTSDSPVTIDGNTTILSGSTLIIDPGVLVQFTGPYSLTVEGTLTATGTSAQPITFTRAAQTEESKWHGIRFENADDSSILEYCIIEYTHRGNSPSSNVRGGAVSITGCSPTIRSCTIRNNYTHNVSRNGAGSAIYISGGSTSLVEYNHLTNNESDSGGAIYVGNDSFAIISHNLIENNLAHSSGGGIYVATGANATISNNILRNNTAEYWGGGAITLWNNNCSSGTCTEVFNNLIYSNVANSTNSDYFGCGGGIYCRYNISNQFNNTIVGNTATGKGGGIYVLNQGNNYIPIITNTIVWNNSAGQDEQISLEVSGTGDAYVSAAEVTYSNVQGGVWPGTGNISVQPLFSYPAIGDFQLLPGSSGIDVGYNSVTNLPAFDFAGRNRIINGGINGLVVDMGALEFDPNAPLLGDIDKNATINLVDTILILQLLSGRDIGLIEDVTGIDVNKDGVVGLAEALYTLQYNALQP